jgi:formate dehydrogenase major subunit
MSITRRSFLQAGAASAVAWSTFGFDLGQARALVRDLKISRADEVRSVCPYCAVGCSMIAYVGGRGETQSFNHKPHLIHIEGDPDSPVNGGSLCPKGAATMHLALSEDRMKHPMHRAPGSLEWQQTTWDEALDRLARLMKSARDERFVGTDDDGNVVNRNEGFAWGGGATITNEEGYLVTKVLRGLGVVGLEQQARL